MGLPKTLRKQLRGIPTRNEDYLHVYVQQVNSMHMHVVPTIRLYCTYTIASCVVYGYQRCNVQGLVLINDHHDICTLKVELSM